MMRLNFTLQSHPTTLRREIKRMFHLSWDEFSRVQLRVAMEEAMQEVVTDRLQAIPYDRIVGKTDRRNEGYPRSYLTRYGLLKLRVPRTRVRETPSKAIAQACRQRERKLDERSSSS